MIYSFSGSLISSNSFLHLPSNNNSINNNVNALTAARGASLTDCGVMKGSQHAFMHTVHTYIPTYTHACHWLRCWINARLVYTAVAIKCPLTSHQRFNLSSAAANHWYVAGENRQSAGARQQNEWKNLTKFYMKYVILFFRQIEIKWKIS